MVSLGDRFVRRLDRAEARGRARREAWELAPVTRRQQLLKQASEMLLAASLVTMIVSPWSGLLVVAGAACLVAYRQAHWRDVKKVQQHAASGVDRDAS